MNKIQNLTDLYKLLVIVGPSGVGKVKFIFIKEKGTLIKKLMTEFENSFAFSISHTTRKPRVNEIHGVNYYYISVDEFKEMISNDEFVEYNLYGSNYYGTSKKELQRIAEFKKICILEIDINGAHNIKKSNLTANYIGIFPPNIETLEKRLLYRNTEAIEVINKRLQEGIREVTEMKKSDIFDFTIVNDDFNTSYKIFRDAVVSLYPNLDKI